MCIKCVFDPVPQTQRRPIAIEIDTHIAALPTPFCRRFNLSKAKWVDFSEDLDEAVDSIGHTLDNYNHFMDAVKVAARKNIPRSCCEQYILGLSNAALSLYDWYSLSFSKNPFGEERLSLGEYISKKLEKKEECGRT